MRWEVGGDPPRVRSVATAEGRWRALPSEHPPLRVARSKRAARVADIDSPAVGEEKATAPHTRSVTLAEQGHSLPLCCPAPGTLYALKPKTPRGLEHADAVDERGDLGAGAAAEILSGGADA